MPWYLPPKMVSVRPSYIVAHICAAATDTFKFAGATGFLVRVLFEVRALFIGLVALVSAFITVRAGPGGLPAATGHVLVFRCTVLRVLRQGRVVGNDTASESSVNQLVSLLKLLLVPFVSDAYKGACLLDALAGICRSEAQNEDHRRGDQKFLDSHGCCLFCCHQRDRRGHLLLECNGSKQRPDRWRSARNLIASECQA